MAMILHKLYFNSTPICYKKSNKKSFILFAILSFFSDIKLYIVKKIDKEEKTQSESKSV